DPAVATVEGFYDALTASMKSGGTAKGRYEKLKPAVERAFERGVNYLYFGSRRTGAFAGALRNLKARRERMVLVVQSYSPIGSLVGWSVERALRKIGYDHADVLLLGMWNRPVPERILDACREVRRRGLVKHLAVSTHHRPLAPVLAAGSDFDVLHVRYNAVNSGAEQDIFPKLPEQGGPGMVAFTATKWGRLPRHGVTAADCYRFVLGQPKVDVCMTGPASAAHVEESLRALELGPLDPDELARIRAIGDKMYGKSRRG
ncbi:MAG: aldo/keto reductase, partial [Acidobacteria bacterium]|nr:aldo/keto reductase [Acidobacteriota bacterium]